MSGDTLDACADLVHLGDVSPVLREICETRRRRSCRRVQVLSRREGGMINIKKTRRDYNELGPQRRNMHPKCRGKAAMRDDHQEAIGSNVFWVLGKKFARHGTCPIGAQWLALTVVDTRSRPCPGSDPRRRANTAECLRAGAAIRTLYGSTTAAHLSPAPGRCCRVHGQPADRITPCRPRRPGIPGRSHR